MKTVVPLSLSKTIGPASKVWATVCFSIAALLVVPEACLGSILPIASSRMSFDEERLSESGSGGLSGAGGASVYQLPSLPGFPTFDEIEAVRRIGDLNSVGSESSPSSSSSGNSSSVQSGAGGWSALAGSSGWNLTDPALIGWVSGEFGFVLPPAPGTRLLRPPRVA